LRLRGAANSS